MQPNLFSRVLLAAVTVSSSLSYGFITPGPGGGGDNPGGIVAGPIQPFQPGRPPEPGRPNPQPPGPVFPNPGHPPHPGPILPGPIRPGPIAPRPERPPYYPPGPIRPLPPMPPPRPIPYPPNPDYGTSRTGYVGRWLTNETLAVGNYVDLGSMDGDWVVDSVSVNMGGSAYDSRVDLLVNGIVEDSAYSPQGGATLYPRSEVLYGLDIQVNGQIYVDSIVVNMHRGNSHNPGYGTISVPLNVYRRLSGRDRLDLTAYINMSQYRGYRIQSIDLQAAAVYNNAVLELLVNSFSSGSVMVSQYSSMVSLVPRNSAVLGYGADSLVLYTNGDIDIQGVTLRLSR